MRERCDQCRFFHANPPNAEGSDDIVWKGETVLGGGQCRRNPPVDPWPHDADTGRFPLVFHVTWCGEFQPRRPEHVSDVAEGT
jgi:hypothetical protein